MPCVLLDYTSCCAGSCCWTAGSSFWSRARGCGHGCVAWVVATWVLLPLLHRGCLILENRDICRVQRSQRSPQGGGPCRRMLRGVELVHPRGPQILMEKAQLCCSCPASECLHTRPQWVPAHSYGLGMGEFSLGLLVKQHRHSLHSSLPSGENQSAELCLRGLFGTRTI